ncbi:MAG: hypothetical protein IH851_13505 [Armatimonadetes bacterium]|nr:hypothetical protein [Armatimonadota bacterium]
METKGLNGRKRTLATIEGRVANSALRRSKDRRWLLTVDLTPDDKRLPTVSVSIRGDRAKQLHSAIERGAHVRVTGRARTVLFLSAFDITSVEQPRTVRCRRAGGMAR